MKTKFKKAIYFGAGIAAPLATLTPIVVTSCNGDATSATLSNQELDFTKKIDNFAITANSAAREKTAWGWTIDDINDNWFDGVPKSGDGIIVKILSVDNLPTEQKINITIQYSTLLNDQVSVVTDTRVYIVNGFASESLEQQVDRLYGNTKIKPTIESVQIPALPENWTMDDINDENFTGLPTSKEDIEVSLKSISFDDTDPLQGKINLTYEFSNDWGYKITRTFEVSGFEKTSYNSNEAAQNHYKLVALLRMINIKSGVKTNLISTDVFEQALDDGNGIDKVRQYFNLPADLKYNQISLVDVKSSEDNTEETMKKGQNMKLGTVQFKFSIFDWVNNKRSVVTTDVFTGFENALQNWNNLFGKVVLTRTAISDQVFSSKAINDHYQYYPTCPPYNSGTNDDRTGARVLNATSTVKQGYSTAKGYNLILADILGRKAFNSNNYAESMFQMKNVNPDHNRFVEMITADAKDNYIGKGPNKNNTIDKAIDHGGLSEVLRSWIFDNTTNQENLGFDWIVFDKILEQSNKDAQLKWSNSTAGTDGNLNMPFGYKYVYYTIGVTYNVWLDYEKTSITFNVDLGMVNAGDFIK